MSLPPSLPSYSPSLISFFRERIVLSFLLSTHPPSLPSLPPSLPLSLTQTDPAAGPQPDHGAGWLVGRLQFPGGRGGSSGRRRSRSGGGGGGRPLLLKRRREGGREGGKEEEEVGLKFQMNLKRQAWSLCVREGGREEGREGRRKREIEHGCVSSRRRRVPPLYYQGGREGGREGST